MCLACGEHVAERLWYLEPEKHCIRSMGLLRDTINEYLHPLVSTALKVFRWKQPYGAFRFTGVSKGALNWLTRTWHGVQVLPDQDTAFKVIDMANELALIPCVCRQVLNPDLPLEWKCIGLNIAARVYFRHQAQNPVRAINKQEAKSIVADWRQRGAYLSVGWLWDANVIWLCSCDEYCGGHRVPEVEWSTVPSFVASGLVRPEECNGCQECARWCHRPGALTFQDGRVVHNQAMCLGCGQCIEHCPTNALGYVPRTVFYDLLTKKVRPLGEGAIKLSSLE